MPLASHRSSGTISAWARRSYDYVSTKLIRPTIRQLAALERNLEGRFYSGGAWRNRPPCQGDSRAAADGVSGYRCQIRCTAAIARSKAGRRSRVRARPQKEPASTRDPLAFPRVSSKRGATAGLAVVDSREECDDPCTSRHRALGGRGSYRFLSLRARPIWFKSPPTDEVGSDSEGVLL